MHYNARLFFITLGSLKMPFIQYPNSPFKLNQPFPPAGDQPTAIAGLLEGLSDGLAYQTLLGVTGSG